MPHDAPAHPLVLYDGDCGFCHHSVRFVLRRERGDRLRFAALASATGRATLVRHGLPADYAGSTVLVEDGRAYTSSTATLRLAKYLRWPWRAGAAFLAVPQPIRDAAYRFVARHRAKLAGPADACALPVPAQAERFIDQ